MKVLLDTNIILDYMMKRVPFYEEACLVLLKIMEGNFTPYISAHSVTNMFYILRKADPVEVKERIQALLTRFHISAVSESTVTSALALKESWKDFEDAVQYVSAKETCIPLLITRNKKDYAYAEGIEVFDPAEFLQKKL